MAEQKPLSPVVAHVIVCMVLLVVGSYGTSLASGLGAFGHQGMMLLLVCWYAVMAFHLVVGVIRENQARGLRILGAILGPVCLISTFWALAMIDEPFPKPMAIPMLLCAVPPFIYAASGRYPFLHMKDPED